ncbi:hypothetical protein FHS83_000017 [Rhizomicrobium palustre]|uniref:Uncharacterized protein n=1 Tax=Rhizomicrobium palustre TaxID=189966 RepID=A0A846MTY9_9PROT|nr:hypothetical protein [Rhizomicrobium palustre]NIK86699.1 hypothetical protein [Rhizomicrobium palustre]
MKRHVLRFAASLIFTTGTVGVLGLQVNPGDFTSIAAKAETQASMTSAALWRQGKRFSSGISGFLQRSVARPARALQPQVSAEFTETGPRNTAAPTGSIGVAPQPAFIEIGGGLIGGGYYSGGNGGGTPGGGGGSNPGGGGNGGGTTPGGGDNGGGATPGGDHPGGGDHPDNGGNGGGTTPGGGGGTTPGGGDNGGGTTPGGGDHPGGGDNNGGCGENCVNVPESGGMLYAVLLAWSLAFGLHQFGRRRQVALQEAVKHPDQP